MSTVWLCHLESIICVSVWRVGRNGYKKRKTPSLFFLQGQKCFSDILACYKGQQLYWEYHGFRVRVRLTLTPNPHCWPCPECWPEIKQMLFPFCICRVKNASDIFACFHVRNSNGSSTHVRVRVSLTPTPYPVVGLRRNADCFYIANAFNTGVTRTWFSWRVHSKS